MAGLELPAAGITATAAAPGAASLAKGELKEPGRGAPDPYRPWEDIKAMTKARTAKFCGKKSCSFYAI